MQWVSGVLSSIGPILDGSSDRGMARWVGGCATSGWATTSGGLASCHSSPAGTSAAGSSCCCDASGAPFFRFCFCKTIESSSAAHGCRYCAGLPECQDRDTTPQKSWVLAHDPCQGGVIVGGITL